MVGMVDNVLRTIRERRSTVRFKSVQVEKEKIQQILEAGRWAPSFMNRQPWEFVVVSDPEVKRQLSQIGVRVTLFSEGIKQSSAVIVVVVDPKKDPYHYIEDGSVSAQNMVLAAHSLGLASYWIGVFDLQGAKRSPEEAVKETLKIPKDLRVIALLPVGVPAYEERSDRKQLMDIIYQDYYGKR